jgi:hypothetical protein
MLNFKDGVALIKYIMQNKNNQKIIDHEILYYSSFMLLIPCFFCIYKKLYISAIFIFYLFITSITYWNDYNNKFKLSLDHFIIIINIIYTYYISSKINKYSYINIFILSSLFAFILSHYYVTKTNNLTASNLWILIHMFLCITILLICNKESKLK